MREAGYSEETCLSVDFAMVSFVTDFEHYRDEMIEVEVDPPPKPRGNKIRVQKRAHSKEDLLEKLGITAEDQEALEILESVVSPDMWGDSDEWEEGEAEE